MLYDFGAWEPSCYDRATAEREWWQFLADWLDDSERHLGGWLFDFRDPDWHRTEICDPADPRSSLHWHQDCGGERSWLTIWASTEPTQIRPGPWSRAVPMLQTKRVYCFRNDRFFHRTPRQAIGAQRWFLRLAIRQSAFEAARVFRFEV